MPASSTIKMTARQFLELGEDPAGVRLELVNGEIIASPSPIPQHSYVVGRLFFILTQYVDENYLGEVYLDVDTLVGDFFVRRPDILYFSADRLHYIGEKAMEGPPNLCVEILSPSSSKTDREDKFDEYCRFGVDHYWIVDPAKRTLDAFQLKRKKYIASGRGQGADVLKLPPFAELEIPLGELWRPKSGKKS